MRMQVEEEGIVPVIEEELETFDQKVQGFQQDEIDPTVFQVYRLREGVYGERQPDAQLMRVKIPGGILTAKQMEALS